VLITVSKFQTVIYAMLKLENQLKAKKKEKHQKYMSALNVFQDISWTITITALLLQFNHAQKFPTVIVAENLFSDNTYVWTVKLDSFLKQIYVLMQEFLVNLFLLVVCTVQVNLMENIHALNVMKLQDSVSAEMDAQTIEKPEDDDLLYLKINRY